MCFGEAASRVQKHEIAVEMAKDVSGDMHETWNERPFSRLPPHPTPRAHLAKAHGNLSQQSGLAHQLGHGVFISGLLAQPL